MVGCLLSVLLVGWLVVVWLDGWMVGWLFVVCFVGWMVGWLFVVCFVGWMVGCFTTAGLFIGCLLVLHGWLYIDWWL